MTKTKIQKLKGINSAIGVAILQGFEALLFSLFYLFFSKIIIKQIGFSIAVLGAKEIVGLIIVILIIGPKTIFNILKKIKSKQGFYFVLAGGIGTTIGNLSLFLAIAWAGSGYGPVLTSLYPVFAIILMRIFLKEKEKKIVWFAIIITSISGVAFILLPILISNNNFKMEKIIGIIFGLIGGLFWAIESLFIKKGLDVKQKKQFKTKEIIVIKNLVSTATTFILIMPLISIFKGNTPYYHFSKLLNPQASKAFWIIIAISINVVLLRIFHIYAIKTIGPKITAVIDTNNFLIPATLVEILQFLPGKLGPIYANERILWWVFLLLIPIVIGVIFAIYFHKDKQTDIAIDIINWDAINANKNKKIK